MGGRFGDHDVLMARTGYTGEDGMEIFIHSAHAEALWNALMETWRRPAHTLWFGLQGHAPP
jgi:glycine cleavage system aminomethyltransferase T